MGVGEWVGEWCVHAPAHVGIIKVARLVGLLWAPAGAGARTRGKEKGVWKGALSGRGYIDDPCFRQAA